MSGGVDALIRFPAAEQAELVEVPRDARPLGAGEVAGPTVVSLVSPGTEIHGMYLGGAFPANPGYAAVFQIEEVGAEVAGLKAGDLALCTGPGGIGGHRSRQRCGQEAAVRLPEGLAPEAAAHARLMLVGMATLTTTAARPPERVLVLGLGPVGNLAAQIFRSCGYQVMAVEPIEARRRLAAEKGIADVHPSVPLEDRSLVAGIALALECSGHEQAVLDACRAVRKKGEVVLVGVPWQRRTEVYAFDVLKAVFRRYVVLRSGWEWELPRHGADFRTGSVFGNLAAALKWLAEGRVRADGLYRRASPRDAQQVYQDLMHRRRAELSVVFDWSEVT